MPQCAACGKEFFKSIYRPQQKFCCRQCYTRNWARNQRGYEPPQPRACEICGLHFMPPASQPKSETCSRQCSRKLSYRRNRVTCIAKVTAWSKKNRGKKNAAMRVYRLRTPKQSAARSKVGYAIRTGKLVRPAHCEACRKVCKPHAHHHKGYDKPLDVQWLCRACHMQVHWG